ncbi:MAG: PAS domain-containing protein [Desulfococcaceae bacterium]|jgi:hypothetical protein|nr:PAS domain-containing protein [Desulfococcaceae bacterium]
MIPQIGKKLDIRIRTKRGSDSHNENQGNIPRNILEKLPTPVIGINADQNIIMVNRKAQSLAVDSCPIETGKKIFEYFPDHITGRVNLSIRTNTVRTIEKCHFEGMLYDLDCIPFSESDQVKGSLMVFRPV